MSIYDVKSITQLAAGISYLGRGILIGKSESGRQAVAAYFISGRSENSRNRVFKERDGALFTEPFDATKVTDPSLIIYAAARRFENSFIVTNGDQTDTVCKALQAGGTFEGALETRCFEPDAPNFTPRISGILDFRNGDFTYKMSILKSADGQGSACARYTFSYPALPGLGHFIHTYNCDGDPIPTFTGEPERVAIPDDIDAFSKEIWDALDANNRISLFVRYFDLASGEETTRVINKHGKEDWTHEGI